MPGEESSAESGGETTSKQRCPVPGSTSEEDHYNPDDVWELLGVARQLAEHEELDCSNLQEGNGFWRQEDLGRDYSYLAMFKRIHGVCQLTDLLLTWKRYPKRVGRYWPWCPCEVTQRGPEVVAKLQFTDSYVQDFFGPLRAIVPESRIRYLITSPPVVVDAHACSAGSCRLRPETYQLVTETFSSKSKDIALANDWMILRDGLMVPSPVCSIVSVGYGPDPAVKDVCDPGYFKAGERTSEGWDYTSRFTMRTRRGGEVTHELCPHGELITQSASGEIWNISPFDHSGGAGGTMLFPIHFTP